MSGYRGSPLGAVDQELWRAKAFLDESNIEFLPAVNEDLGATAVLGAQQAVLDPAVEHAVGGLVDQAGRAQRAQDLRRTPRLRRPIV